MKFFDTYLNYFVLGNVWKTRLTTLSIKLTILDLSRLLTCFYDINVKLFSRYMRQHPPPCLQNNPNGPCCLPGVTCPDIEDRKGYPFSDFFTHSPAAFSLALFSLPCPAAFSWVWRTQGWGKNGAEYGLGRWLSSIFVALKACVLSSKSQSSHQRQRYCNTHL